MHKNLRKDVIDVKGDSGFELAEEPGIDCATMGSRDAPKTPKGKTPGTKDAEKEKEKRDENPLNGNQEDTKPACDTVKEGQELDGRYQIVSFMSQDRRNGAY